MLSRSALGQKVSVPAPSPISTETIVFDQPICVPEDPTGAVVLDYCTTVRGILNNDQGGPLHPPGLQMADALGEVRESIQHNLDAKKGGSLKSNSADWPVVSTGDWSGFKPSKRRSAGTSKTSRKSPRSSKRKRRVE